MECFQNLEECNLIPKIEPIENELLDDLPDKLVPKTEPIGVDLIKKEEIYKEECFVVQGLVGSSKFDEISVKEEIVEHEGNSSSSNVRRNFCYVIHSSARNISSCFIRMNFFTF